MNPKQGKKKRKASYASVVTSLSWIKEETEEDLEPNFKSLELIAQKVPDCVQLLDPEELNLDRGNTKDTNSNHCKRSKNSKQVQITSHNEKDEPSKRVMNFPIEEVTEGNRESSSKKKHKKSKKNKEKYKNKEKCGQREELQKPEKLWQQWTPRPLPVSIISAKAKRKKCLVRNCSSVKVSDENLMGAKHEEQREEDKTPQAVNNLQSKSKMVHKFLCLPTSQESLCSPANEKEMQQDEETYADWEEASRTEKIAQDTLRKGRSAVAIHCGILNPFHQSSATTSTPKASLDKSLLRHLRCLKPPHSRLTGASGNRGFTCEEKLNNLCLKSSKDVQVMKKSPEFNEDYSNSQDLFITQKKFLPSVQSDSNSSYSVEETADEERDEQLRSADAKRLRFISPSLPEPTDLCRCGLQSPKGRPCEKGTQTADFFSSPAFATSLRFCQRVKVQHCSEEPIDLSLPSRIRAKSSTHVKNSPDSSPVQEGSINPSNQHTPVLLSSLEAQNVCQLLPLSAHSDGKKKGLKSTFVISQNRRSDDGKFVQTFLNESYFFKVKGQGKPKDPRMPLVKKRGKNKKTEKRCDWS